MLSLLRKSVARVGEQLIAVGMQHTPSSLSDHKYCCCSAGEAQSLLRQRQQELREGPPKEPTEGAPAGIGSKAESTVL